MSVAKSEAFIELELELINRSKSTARLTFSSTDLYKSYALYT